MRVVVYVVASGTLPCDVPANWSDGKAKCGVDERYQRRHVRVEQIPECFVRAIKACWKPNNLESLNARPAHGDIDEGLLADLPVAEHTQESARAKKSAVVHGHVRPWARTRHKEIE